MSGAIAVIEIDTCQVEIIQEGVRVIESGGAGSIAFDFFQPTPTTLWNINHNSGQHLTPRCFNNGGAEIVGMVQHLSVNQVQVAFLIAQSGFARLA